jgi:hypothetical protein
MIASITSLPRAVQRKPDIGLWNLRTGKSLKTTLTTPVLIALAVSHCRPRWLTLPSPSSAHSNATTTVRNSNFDKEYKIIYTQEARLNGEVYTKNWIGHEFFTEGWMLELVLGDTEGD